MSMPRSARNDPFPYSSSQVCYLALDSAGQLTQVDHDFRSAEAAYRRAAAGRPCPRPGVEAQPLR